MVTSGGGKAAVGWGKFRSGLAMLLLMGGLLLAMIFVYSNEINLGKLEHPRPTLGAISRRSKLLQGPGFEELLPDVNVSISRIGVPNPFLYGYLNHDEDSFQVSDPRIRALEPGLTALWLSRVSGCCATHGHVVDVGSHFGYYSLLSASMGCSYAAFEPVPTFGALLGMNVRLNDLEGAGEVYHCAVGAQEGVVKMAVPSSGILGTAHIGDSKDPNWRTVEVPVTTLDQALGVRATPPICAMKVDVEGFEPGVIAGGLDFLRSRRVPHLMMEFSPGLSLEGLETMLEQLHGLGYQALVIGWDLAKQNAPVSTIDMMQFDSPALAADISTPQARNALIKRGYFNTNVWFSLKEHA